MESKTKEFLLAIQNEQHDTVLEMLKENSIVHLVVEAKSEGFGNYLHEVIYPMLPESNTTAKRVIDRLCKPAHGFSLYLNGDTTEQVNQNA